MNCGKKCLQYGRGTWVCKECGHINKDWYKKPETISITETEIGLLKYGCPPNCTPEMHKEAMKK